MSSCCHRQQIGAAHVRSKMRFTSIPSFHHYIGIFLHLASNNLNYSMAVVADDHGHVIYCHQPLRTIFGTDPIVCDPQSCHSCRLIQQNQKSVRQPGISVRQMHADVRVLTRETCHPAVRDLYVRYIDKVRPDDVFGQARHVKCTYLH